MFSWFNLSIRIKYKYQIHCNKCCNNIALLRNWNKNNFGLWNKWSDINCITPPPTIILQQTIFISILTFTVTSRQIVFFNNNINTAQGQTLKQNGIDLSSMWKTRRLHYYAACSTACNASWSTIMHSYLHLGARRVTY